MCEFEVPMVGVQQGWQCPICKRVYSPFVSECLYCGKFDNVVKSNGASTGQPVIDWCKHMSYTGTGMPEVTLNGTELGSKTKMEEMKMLRNIGWSQVGENADDKDIRNILGDGNQTIKTRY